MAMLSIAKDGVITELYHYTKMARMEGLEPPTYGFVDHRSNPTELHANEIGSSSWVRTSDQRINSPVQLPTVLLRSNGSTTKIRT